MALRGAEQMCINTRHIIDIKHVSHESQVVKLIKKQQSQKPERQK